MTKRTPNVLDNIQRFKLAKALNEFTNQDANKGKFSDWNDAERYFQRLMGVPVTKSNIKAALEAVERTDYPLIRVSDKPTALTNMLVRVKNLEEAISVLLERLDKLEKELRG